MTKQLRDMFEQAVNLILVSEENSPEFNFAFAVMQAYKILLIERRASEYQKELDDYGNIPSTGCF